MDKEKRLPSDSSKSPTSKGEKRLPPGQPSDAGPLPEEGTHPISENTLKERILKSTMEGGLTKIPDNFNDKDGDWIVVKSENVFEILYLDYEQCRNITPEIVENNYKILKLFWDEKIATMTGPAKTQIINKYGGSDGTERTLQGYPIKLGKAYKKLNDTGIEGCFNEIDSERKKAGEHELQQVLDVTLADGKYELSEWNAVLQSGRRWNLKDDEIREFLLKNLHGQGFIEIDKAEDPLSAIWMTHEKYLEVCKREFITFLDGRLQNGIYNPGDYLSITENAADYLKRDATKLKEILLEYLKGRAFEPVKEVRPGYELTVKWNTNWAEEDTEDQPPGKGHLLRNAIVSALIAACLFIGYKIISKPSENAQISISLNGC